MTESYAIANPLHFRQLPGRGGYSEAVSIGGIRGSELGWAVDEMGSRGFDGVDGFSASGQVYNIFYQRQTRQCVQMVAEANRVIAIMEVDDHPKCR